MAILISSQTEIEILREREQKLREVLAELYKAVVVAECSVGRQVDHIFPAPYGDNLADWVKRASNLLKEE